MLDVAVRAVQATYTQRPITRKIDVVIVDDGARVGALAQRLTAWTPGHGILGTYFPRFDVLISQRRVDGGLTTGVGTFFHEAAHALIDDASPTLPPAWFNEGFATLFEQARVVDGAFVHGNPSPGRDAVLVEALDAGRLPSLASVLVMSEADVYGDGELPYPLARSIFLYVLRQHGDAVVAAWIAAVRAGASPSDALVHVTKTSIADLDAAWRGFIDETCRPAAELARLRAQPASLADWQRLAARYPEYGAVAIEMVDVAWQARDEAAVVRAANVALRAPRLLEPERAWRGLGWALELTDRDASIAARRAAIAAQPWLEHVDVDRPAALAAQLETVGDLDGAREVRDAVAAELGLDATYVW